MSAPDDDLLGILSATGSAWTGATPLTADTIRQAIKRSQENWPPEPYGGGHVVHPYEYDDALRRLGLPPGSPLTYGDYLRSLGCEPVSVPYHVPVHRSVAAGGTALLDRLTLAARRGIDRAFGA